MTNNPNEWCVAYHANNLKFVQSIWKLNYNQELNNGMKKKMILIIQDKKLEKEFIVV
jgi:hypothetical protein